ncbi:rifin PIR protein, putative [Plasmodium reichenowi]|uniref:Rifin PIR protein, putative n=1 Tax=Plasmodium reichenowi TaxID=5854 RepID=A0A2P9DN57_PLARE|nr:rifin PIR protein, putative [Plasmodium reichenowi]
MKLHYSNILFFAIPLNILVISYEAHNKNKIYHTPHHTTRYTSRVLSEGDIQSSIYDKDADMKLVKENFDRQTSQRFEEYEERMKDKRQKRKEERDKNIQKIIEKDKMDKSLAEKVEKGCLRCGCGLGGVAASVGVFGGLGTYGWKTAALAAAAQKGIDAGISSAIQGLKTKFGLETLSGDPLNTVLNANNFNHPMRLYLLVHQEYSRVCEADPTNTASALCSYKGSTHPQTYQGIVANAQTVATDAGQAAATAQETEIAAANAASTYSYSAIGYSVLAIFIIVLVMIIIYLILRHRRKKKLTKKAQYTKLLNQ